MTSVRSRVRLLKHEAKEAGNGEIHRLCVRILNANLRLYSADNQQFVDCEIDHPITEYVQAIGVSLSDTQYGYEKTQPGIATYRGQRVYAQTYQWSTAS